MKLKSDHPCLFTTFEVFLYLGAAISLAGVLVFLALVVRGLV